MLISFVPTSIDDLRQARVILKPFKLGIIRNDNSGGSSLLCPLCSSQES